jgi:hypothetical protein
MRKTWSVAMVCGLAGLLGLAKLDVEDIEKRYNQVR